MTLPDWLPESLWAAWLGHREDLNKEKPPSKRKPYTKYAQERAILKLGRFRAQGMDPVAVVERAMDKGWDGFWPLPDHQRTLFKPPEVHKPDKPLSILERSRQSWAKHESQPVPIRAVLAKMQRQMK